MAEVLPFKGYRYNEDIIADMADVVAPPYDVIAPRTQEVLYRRHPQNVIRLILGKNNANDNDLENVHTRARGYLNQWRRDRILIQDAQPRFYLTALSFQVGEDRVTRFGLMASVGLHPFSDGIILPHEHTFSKVKSERLLLMKATNANLCPIFGIYGDESKEMVDWQRSIVAGHTAEIDLIDDDGFRHQLWFLHDRQSLEYITRFFESRKIYIADGHHRYETALNYREWIRSRTPDFSAGHPANYIMMNLSSMQDPGMVIMPAHRLLKHVPQASLARMIEQAPQYFDILAMEAAMDPAQNAANIQAALTQHSHRHAIGLISGDPNLLWVLVLKDGVMERLFGSEMAEPLRVLDVSVLTHLILMNLLGLDQAALDDAERIVYSTIPQEAARMVAERECDCAFFLNPTRIEQVQRVAEAGLNMPRKSTYFYPKVISGQVFNILE